MTDTRSEAHEYSLRNVFPRLGETGATDDICTRRWKSRPCSGGIVLLRGGAKAGHL
jgi:hypothetical protein